MHALARVFFRGEKEKAGQTYRSEVLGFQMLVEAFTGIRTSEALRLRWDAKPGEAGYIGGEYLHLQRSKKGVSPWAKIHPALKDLLAMLKKWRDLRHPRATKSRCILNPFAEA